MSHGYDETHLCALQNLERNTSYSGDRGDPHRTLAGPGERCFLSACVGLSLVIAVSRRPLFSLCAHGLLYTPPPKN